jgi:ribosome-associated protein
MREIEITGDVIRLGQLLKLAGIADSGAEAKALLAEEAVTVTREPEARRGRQLHTGDVVRAAGEEVTVSPRPASPGR